MAERLKFLDGQDEIRIDVNQTQDDQAPVRIEGPGSQIIRSATQGSVMDRIRQGILKRRAAQSQPASTPEAPTEPTIPADQSRSFAPFEDSAPLTDLKFDKALANTLGYEGAGVDRHEVGDSGISQLGVTQKAWDAYSDKIRVPRKPVTKLSDKERRQFYKDEYAKPLNLDNLPNDVAMVAFDYGVNAGPGRAARDLQTVLGVKADGAIGPKTLAAIKNQNPKALAEKLLAMQESHYARLVKNDPAKYGKFQAGWQNRINAQRQKLALGDFGQKVREAMAVEEANPELKYPEDLDLKIKFNPWVSQTLAGLDRMNAQLARIPAYAYNFFAILPNRAAVALGMPEQQVQAPDWLVNNPVATYYDRSAELHDKSDERFGSVTEIDENGVRIQRPTNLGDIIESGEAGEAAAYIGWKVLENAPQQVMLIGFAQARLADLGLGVMGAMSAAGKSAENQKKNLDPITATVNATLSGLTEVATEKMLGTPKVFKDIKEQLIKKFGAEGAKVVMKDAAMIFLKGSSSEGIEEVAASFAEDIADWSMGVNPNALKGMAGRAFEAGVIGAASGATMTAPAATASAYGDIRQIGSDRQDARISAMEQDGQRNKSTEGDDTAETLVFVSPSIETSDAADMVNRENVTTLYKKTKGGIHASFKSAIRAVMIDLGVPADVSSALGIWEDGGEDTVIARLPEGTDIDTIKYLGAQAAKLYPQKAYLWFKPKKSGKHQMTKMTLPLKYDEAVGILLRNGIKFATIVPTKDGTEVYQFHDDKSQLKHSASVAKSMGGAIEMTSGDGGFVGGETRASAVAQYNKDIKESRARIIAKSLKEAKDVLRRKKKSLAETNARRAGKGVEGDSRADSRSKRPQGVLVGAEESLDQSGKLKVFQVAKAIAKALDVRYIGRDATPEQKKQRYKEGLRRFYDLARQSGRDIKEREFYAVAANKAIAQLIDTTFPELTDPDKQGIFKVLLAITSNGNLVSLNTKYAMDQMRHYLDTGDFNTKTVYARNEISAHLKKLQELIDQYGEVEAIKHLTEYQKQLTPTGKQSAEPDAPRAVDYFGDKIGRYFTNVFGLGREVTIDLWQTRLYHILMGDIKSFYEVSVKRNKKGDFETGNVFPKVIESPGKVEKRVMREAITELAKELGETPADLQSISWHEIKQLYAKFSGTDVEIMDYNDAVTDILGGQSDPEARYKVNSPLLDALEKDRKRAAFLKKRIEKAEDIEQVVDAQKELQETEDRIRENEQALQDHFDKMVSFGKDVKFSRPGTDDLGNELGYEEEKRRNEEGLAFIREFLPEIADLVEQPASLTTDQGMALLGDYLRGRIRAKSGQPLSVYKHEGFHAFFDLFVSPQDKIRLLDAIQREYPDRVKAYADKYGVSQDRAAEEVMAELMETIDNKRFTYEGKTIPEQIVTFLQQVIEKMKVFFGIDKAIIQDMADAFYEMRRSPSQARQVEERNLYAGVRAQGFEDVPEEDRFWAPDKKLRFEIPDKDAELTFKDEVETLASEAERIKKDDSIPWQDRGKLFDAVKKKLEDAIKSKRTLGAMLDHPGLYKRYPWAKDVPVIVKKLPRGMMGLAYNSQSMLSTEGSHIKISSRYLDNMTALYSNSQMESYESFRNTMLHEVQHMIQAYENFAQGGTTSRDGLIRYIKLLGEVEARDVSARSRMTEEQRRALKAYESQIDPVEAASRDNWKQKIRSIEDVIVRTTGQVDFETPTINAPGTFRARQIRQFFAKPTPKNIPARPTSVYVIRIADESNAEKDFSTFPSVAAVYEPLESISAALAVLKNLEMTIPEKKSEYLKNYGYGEAKPENIKAYVVQETHRTAQVGEDGDDRWERNRVIDRKIVATEEDAANYDETKILEELQRRMVGEKKKAIKSESSESDEVPQTYLVFEGKATPVANVLDASQKWLSVVRTAMKQGMTSRDLESDPVIQRADGRVLGIMTWNGSFIYKPSQGKPIEASQIRQIESDETRYKIDERDSDILKDIDQKLKFGGYTQDQIKTEYAERGIDIQFKGEAIRVSPSKVKGMVREMTGQVKDEELADLKDKFREQAKGARFGYRQGVIDARERLTAVMREKLEKQGDEAEAVQSIKDAIVDYALEQLPKAERGTLLTVIRDAKTLNDAMEAGKKIDQILEQSQKKGAIGRIRALVGQAMDSGRMAVEYKDIVKKLVSGVELKGHREETLKDLQKTKDFIEAELKAGRDVEIPNRIYRALQILERKPASELELSELEAIITKIELVIKLGKLRLASREAQYEADKVAKIKELASGRVRPIRSKEGARDARLALLDKLIEQAKDRNDQVKLKKYQAEQTKLMKQKSFRVEAKGWLEGIRDYFDKNVANSQVLDKARQPMDHFFQTIGDQYHRVFKAPIDLLYGNYTQELQALTDRTAKILKELKLDQTNFRRIGIFAANEQENGREKLLKSGITEAQIDGIKLTPEEKRFYDFMQNEMETVYPRYKDVIQNVYNAPVGKVTKYFPFMTDYTEMSELEVRQRLMENPEFQTQPKKNVDLSASKSRVDRRGNVAVRIDANEVFMKHMQSVLYAVNMAKEIKMLQEIAKSPKFASAAGDVAQIMTVEWLDLMARNGGIAGQDPMPFLDFVRKNTSLAMLSLNPTSIAIQSTAIIDAAGFIGRYAFSGQMMQGSREWRDFAMNNSAELRNRVGDDQAYREFSDAWYDKLRSAAMTPQKILDGTVATGVFLGAYQKFMDEKGLKADPKNPNRDGIEYANKMVRMSQASALYKDLPLFISKGLGTNWASLIGKKGKDNRSWGKAWSQFQTPLFYRYANLRDYAITKAQEGKWKEAANVVGSQVLAVITEIALRHGVKGLTALAVMSMLGEAGGGDDEEKEFGDYLEEFWKTFVGNVPFISNAMSLFTYKQAPVASLAIAGRTLEDFKYFQMAKKPETKRKWAAILALDLAAIATGAPTPRLTYVIKKATEKKKKGLRYA